MTVQEFCEIKAEITHSEIPIKTQEKLIRILKDVMSREAKEVEKMSNVTIKMLTHET